MIIVVEGVDGTGKTTLAKYLSLAMKIPYAHFSAPSNPSEAERQYFYCLERNKNKDIILDRSWVGEFVYCLKRNYYPDYLEKINEFITKSKIKILYILLDPLRDNMKSVSEHTEEDFENLKLNEKFLAEFRIALSKFKGEKVIFNPRNFNSAKSMCSWVEVFVNDWVHGENPYHKNIDNYALTMFNPYERFIGVIGFDVPERCKCEYFKNFALSDYYKEYKRLTFGTGNTSEPDFLFVGEAPGWQGCGRTGIPFYNDASGMYFRYLLFKNGILESQCYITNVVKCTPKDNKLDSVGRLEMKNSIKVCSQQLEKELLTIRPKNIVALGSTAADWLNGRNYKFTRVNHPAHPLYTGKFAEYEKYFAQSIGDLNV